MPYADAIEPLYRSALIAALTGVGVHLRGPADPVRDTWLTLLKTMRAQLPVIQAPLVIPAHVNDDALFGVLDLGASLAVKTPIKTPGLLAQAAQRTVIICMAERLSAAQANKLAQGIERYADPLTCVVAQDEGAPDEDLPIGAGLLQHLGITIDLRGLTRAELEQFQACDVPPGLAQAWADFRQVEVDEHWVTVISAISLALGIEGMRALIQSSTVMRANAALDGRTKIEQVDLDRAIELVLLPKATQIPEKLQESDQEQNNQNPAEPTNAPPDDLMPEPSKASESPATDLEELAQTILQASLATLPSDLLLKLAAHKKIKASAAGSSGAVHHNQHGRKGRVRRQARGQRPDLLATLQEAVRWQAIRRQEAKGLRQIKIEKSDLRFRQTVQKARSTLIFAVDASGSAALQRLAETKGAIELLLAQCYVRRDQVAMISFRGQQGQIILSATRSLTRAKRQLAGLPGGGATPIAAGLDCAIVEAKRAIKRGETPYFVLLSDGRANITRAGQPGRTQAHQEALFSAKQLAQLGVTSLMIDTSQQISSGSKSAVAREIASALEARYLPLPAIGAVRLAQLVENALERP
jgi:magnesium chelatase subunit D